MRTLLIIIAAILLFIILGGGGAYYIYFIKPQVTSGTAAAHKPAAKPELIKRESITANRHSSSPRRDYGPTRMVNSRV